MNPNPTTRPQRIVRWISSLVLIFCGLALVVGEPPNAAHPAWLFKLTGLVLYAIGGIMLPSVQGPRWLQHTGLRWVLSALLFAAGFYLLLLDLRGETTFFVLHYTPNGALFFVGVALLLFGTLALPSTFRLPARLHAELSDDEEDESLDHARAEVVSEVLRQGGLVHGSIIDDRGINGLRQTALNTALSDALTEEALVFRLQEAARGLYLRNYTVDRVRDLTRKSEVLPFRDPTEA